MRPGGWAAPLWLRAVPTARVVSPQKPFLQRLHIPSDGGPLKLYKDRVAQGTLRHDPAQEQTAERLQQLYNQLKTYEPLPESSEKTDEKSLWQRLWGGAAAKQSTLPKLEPKVRGVWLYGQVGSGKTLLMELFYESLGSGARKRRVHFDAFMLEVYRGLWVWQNSAQRSRARAMDAIARQTLSQATVLCFDEFQVADVASSQMLNELFDRLFHMGVVCVITSNRIPADLHKGGVQQDLFAPFVQLIETFCETLTVGASADYRAVAHDAGVVGDTYFSGLGAEAALKLRVDRAYAETGTSRGPAALELYGRQLPIAAASVERPAIAEFTFEQLCSDAAALGPADFLAICEQFPIVALSGVPVLTVAQKNEARRLIALVDAAYENRTRLLVAAAAAPNALFDPKAAPDVSSGVAHLPLFSGEEEIFAFRRTVSRLLEMQSAQYWRLSHRPQGTASFLARVVPRSGNFTTPVSPLLR